jgi:hypothetical protein
MRPGGTVLLVESDPVERERLRGALETAGYEVISCPGPTAPDYTCIGGREGYCPLVEGADVVVLDPWLAGEDPAMGTSAQDLIELYTMRARTVVLLGPIGWSAPSIGGHVVALGDRPTDREVVAAVQAAPDTSGFVIRGV